MPSRNSGSQPEWREPGAARIVPASNGGHIPCPANPGSSRDRRTITEPRKRVARSGSPLSTRSASPFSRRAARISYIPTERWTRCAGHCGFRPPMEGTRHWRKEQYGQKRDKDLFKRMRSLGVRKSRAREVAEAAQQPQGRAQGSTQGGWRPLRCRGRDSRPDEPRSAEAKGNGKEGPGRESGMPRAPARPPRRQLAPAPRPNQPSAAAGTPPRREGCPGPGRGLEREPTFGPSTLDTTGPVADGFRHPVGLRRRSGSWVIGSGDG